jgi:hypothetical protein
MSRSTAYGDVAVDTSVVTAEQAIATISGTGITDYDSSDIPVVLPADARRTIALCFLALVSGPVECGTASR